MTPKQANEIQAALARKLITPAQAEALKHGDTCGQCGSTQHKTDACFYVRCSACQDTLVIPSHDPCFDCIKARHKAALTHKCSCPKRLKRPRTVTNKIRTWVSCDRCLGTIRQIS